MASQIQSFLCFAGTELASGIRALSYVRRGLAGPSFTVALTDESRGSYSLCLYHNLYHNEYCEEFPASDLACYCPALDEGPYIDPEVDDAPWYNGNALSKSFLGLHITEADLGNVPNRTITAAGRKGGVLSSLRHKFRVMHFKGYMFAANQAGMAYGERWITEVLQGGITDDLYDEMTILPACPDITGLPHEVIPAEECVQTYPVDYSQGYDTCPPDDTCVGYQDEYSDIYGCDEEEAPAGGISGIYDPNYEDTYGELTAEEVEREAFRTLKRVGIIDGPVFTALQGSATCNVQQVEFQIGAAVPYLYGLPVNEYEDLVVNGDVSILIENGEWIGDKVVNVYATVPDAEAVTSILIKATPAPQGDCNAVALMQPCTKFEIGALPANSRIVVDSSIEKLFYYDPSRKILLNGVSKLSALNGPPGWIAVPPCSQVCVSVKVMGQAVVRIDSMTREV